MGNARSRKTDRVSILAIMRPTLPFMMRHMDCIVSIEPASSQWNRYVLCVIDDCTHWPSLFVLQNLTVKAKLFVTL